MERDIRELRADMKLFSDRLSVIETQSSGASRLQSDIDRRVKQLMTTKQFTEQYRVNMDHQIKDIRQMYVSATYRINNLDLITNGLVKGSNTCPVPASPNTRNPDRLTVLETKMRSLASSAVAKNGHMGHQ